MGTEGNSTNHILICDLNKYIFKSRVVNGDYTGITLYIDYLIK